MFCRSRLLNSNTLFNSISSCSGDSTIRSGFSFKGLFLDQLLKTEDEFSHEITVFIVILSVHSCYPECIELWLAVVSSPKSQLESKLMSWNCFWTKLVALKPELWVPTTHNFIRVLTLSEFWKEQRGRGRKVGVGWRLGGWTGSRREHCQHQRRKRKEQSCRGWGWVHVLLAPPLGMIMGSGARGGPWVQGPGSRRRLEGGSVTGERGPHHYEQPCLQHFPGILHLPLHWILKTGF